MIPFASPMMAKAAASGGDPYFANTIFLSGMELNDASLSSITDESPAGNNLTNNNTGIATRQVGPKFGTYCASSSSAGFWKSASAAPFNFGSQTWTIEGWFLFSTAPSSSFHNLMAQHDTGANQRSWTIAVASNVLTLYLSTGGTVTITSANGAWTPATNTWYHIAADYDGTAYRVYSDGVMRGKEVATRTLHASTVPFTLGAALNNGAGNSAFAGRMDEVRITKGVARYASDEGYTVPTAAFPRS